MILSRPVALSQPFTCQQQQQHQQRLERTHLSPLSIIIFKRELSMGSTVGAMAKPNQAQAGGSKWILVVSLSFVRSGLGPNPDGSRREGKRGGGGALISGLGVVFGSEALLQYGESSLGSLSDRLSLSCTPKNYSLCLSVCAQAAHAPARPLMAQLLTETRNGQRVPFSFSVWR